VTYGRLTQTPLSKRWRIEVEHLADQVIATGTAFAGLILVFLGIVLASFDNYDEGDKGAVRSRFRFQAVVSCVGLISALTAAGLGLAFFAVTGSPSLVHCALVCLGISATCVLVLGGVAFYQLFV
jgi:hypothetical protein